MAAYKGNEKAVRGGPEATLGDIIGATSPVLASSEEDGLGTSLPAPLLSVPSTVIENASVSGSYGISEELSAGNRSEDPYFSFAFPVPGGKNWGELHSYNAVDISAPCGTAILASAPGTVVSASTNAWNSGYGNYLTIRHENGARTKYAHNLRNLAEEGMEVGKGDRIALIGNSGNVTGETGCHVHFEVQGGENPFGK